MILKALYDYYHNVGTLPQRGTEIKDIAYIIIIDNDGRFLRFESTREDKNRGASFLVKKGVGRTSAPVSNVLWDNGKYVLGFHQKEKKCFDLFRVKVQEIASKHPEDESIQALSRFYDQPKEELEEAFSKDPLIENVREDYSMNFSFRLEGEDRIIAEKTELYSDEEDESADDGPEGVCLVTGKKGHIVRLTTATPIPGCSPKAGLVGMQINSGYDSYGKEQAYNAPISDEAEAAYSTALKTMLGPDSQNKARIGDRIFLFWGNGKNEAEKRMQESTFAFFNPDKKEDPNEKAGKVESMFKSVWSGEIKTTLDDRFYILGLAPNVGRIAVVSWSDMSLREFAGKILMHFEDMEIIDSRAEKYRKPYKGISQMLSNVTLGGKVSDSLPNLAESVMYAIINGTPYPYQLYTCALERIRAEVSDMSVSIGRASILKAYLNRHNRNNHNIKPISKMLDKESTNVGYLCGRLAAVLEHVQEVAKSGDSIRTRYMAAASATPSIVFPAMLNLTIHHTEKVASERQRIYFEKLKQEIIDKLPASRPILTLATKGASS